MLASSYVHYLVNITDTKSMANKIQKVLNCQSQNVLLCKDPVKRMKRQHRDWEKIFTNYKPDKEIGSRIYEEFSKSNS